MDRLPLEAHRIVIECIADKLPHNTTSVDEPLKVAFGDVLLSLLHLGLASHYYQSATAPFLRIACQDTIKLVAKAPWQVPKDEVDHSAAWGIIPQRQYARLFDYLNHISDLSPPFRKWIVKETAPKTPYRMFTSRVYLLEECWITLGLQYFHRGWVKGLKLKQANFWSSEGPAGLLCMLKSFNPELIMLRGYSTVVEILTSYMVKEEAKVKRKNRLMGLDVKSDDREYWQRQKSHLAMCRDRAEEKAKAKWVTKGKAQSRPRSERA